MRILYHHRTLGDGAEGIHVASIVEAFQYLGHDTKVAALIGERTNVMTSRAQRLNSLVRLTPRVMYEILELGYTLAGYRLLRESRVGWKPDLLYERYTLFNFAGLAFARKAKIPLVLEVNSPLAFERANYEQLVLKRLALYCERVVCSKANLVVVVSTPLKEYLIAQGVPSNQINVVPNGTDPQKFFPDESTRNKIRDRIGVNKESVVIGFVGILRAWHGIESLCEAMASLAPEKHNFHLLIVGDGPIRPEVEKLVRNRGLESYVTITGRVSHDQMPSYITAFDIGVSPRATFYASPMKLLEYMATGVAVVAPRMSNIQDIVTDGVNGVLFTPEDVGDLVAKLSDMIQNPELRRRMGINARETVIKGRTWVQNAQQVIDWAIQESR